MMGKPIIPGTVMITSRARLPESLHLATEPCADGWRSVTDFDAYSFGRRLREAGWTFLAEPVPIEVNVLGFGGEDTVRRGVRRLIRKLTAQRFQCFDIAEITKRSFLGIPYVRVSAQLRNVQQGPHHFRHRNEFEQPGTARQ
jgi:hypothetical protein